MVLLFDPAHVDEHAALHHDVLSITAQEYPENRFAWIDTKEYGDKAKDVRSHDPLLSVNPLQIRGLLGGQCCPEKKSYCSGPCTNVLGTILQIPGVPKNS